MEEIKELYVKKILAKKLRTKRLEEKVLYWYLFFMSFPAIVILFNLNLYLFPFLALLAYKRYGFFIKINSFIQIFAIAFIVGSIISTFKSTSYDDSLAVLPNYIYWGIIIMFFVSHRHNFNFDIIFKALAHGVIGSTIYYFFLQKLIIPFFPIARPMAQNGYAFLLICFAPVMVHYVMISKKKWAALYTLIGLIGAAFLSGSRAGSVLVLVGGSLAFMADRLNFKNGIPALIGAFMLVLILETSGVAPFFIKTLNPEAFDLIYHSNDVFKNDISYLTRVAMVQKGMNIYNEYPVYGIGLNLFKEYQGTVDGKTEWINLFNFKALETGISSHNSYINLLAEGGLVVFVPTILILGFCLLKFLRYFNKLSLKGKVAAIGLIVMCFHMYFVAAIVNVFAWFNFALTASLLDPVKKSALKRA